MGRKQALFCLRVLVFFFREFVALLAMLPDSQGCHGMRRKRGFFRDDAVLPPS